MEDHIKKKSYWGDLKVQLTHSTKENGLNKNKTKQNKIETNEPFIEISIENKN